MKVTLSAILFLILLSACRTTAPVASGVSPCTEERYVNLKEKPLDEMTQREYEYFIRKDQECTEFAAGQAETDGPNRSVIALSAFVTVVFFAVAFGLLG